VTRSTRSQRQLIALNTGEALSRDSVCRIASHVEEWGPAGEVPPLLAARLAIPERHRREADRLLHASDAIAAGQLSTAHETNTEILTVLDRGYPAALRELDLPPPVLYIRGRISPAPAIAVVGSRQATPQGLESAELFGRGLAEQGLTVVSGFARGIDLAAHRGTLSVAAGRTIAVLGCGLDVDYPRGRQRLRRQIPTCGALLTEFSFGTQPRALNFPIRNRIIAALSLGVLVVEATPKSGSLITARLALDLGRDVYAVPGSIFEPRAAGPNALIQDGALLVQRPAEIVASLPTTIRDSLSLSIGEPPPTVSGPTGALLELMTPGQLLSAEHLCRASGEALEQTLARLLELEMLGLVERFPGAVFCRKASGGLLAG
jgi:DNA processing protein